MGKMISWNYLAEKSMLIGVDIRSLELDLNVRVVEREEGDKIVKLTVVALWENMERFIRTLQKGRF